MTFVLSVVLSVVTVSFVKRKINIYVKECKSEIRKIDFEIKWQFLFLYAIWLAILLYASD